MIKKIHADRNEVKIRVKYIDIVNGLYLYIWMDETYKYNLERMCCL